MRECASFRAGCRPKVPGSTALSRIGCMVNGPSLNRPVCSPLRKWRVASVTTLAVKWSIILHKSSLEVALAGGVIGRLDPGNGTIRLWPVPSPAPGIPSSPSCLTVAPNGLVWFGDMTGGALGTLDPRTGQVTLYDLPNPQTQIFSMSTHTNGHLWFTEVL